MIKINKHSKSNLFVTNQPRSVKPMYFYNAKRLFNHRGGLEHVNTSTDRKAKVPGQLVWTKTVENDLPQYLGTQKLERNCKVEWYGVSREAGVNTILKSKQSKSNGLVKEIEYLLDNGVPTRDELYEMIEIKNPKLNAETVARGVILFEELIQQLITNYVLNRSFVENYNETSRDYKMYINTKLRDTATIAFDGVAYFPKRSRTSPLSKLELFKNYGVQQLRLF